MRFIFVYSFVLFFLYSVSSVSSPLSSKAQISNPKFSQRKSLQIVRVRLLKNVLKPIKNLHEQDTLIKKSSGKYDLVRIVNFDEYLAGVIENEMPITWHDEALKAQAVIARSYALVKILESKNRHYDLDATVMDQVYSPYRNRKSIEIVRKTRNQILETSEGKTLKAFYHSDCGGKTIEASQVWPGAIDTGTAQDPWCLNRNQNQWSFAIDRQEFYSRLSFNPESDMKIFGKYVQQKVHALKIVDQYFSVQKLRQIFGFSKIRSTPTHVMQTDKEIVFSGRGYGHGAGLCQWGSAEMAKMGKSHIQILQHYYPKAQLSEDRRHLIFASAR